MSEPSGSLPLRVATEADDADRAVLERLATGDLDALDALYDRYKTMAYSIAFRITADATLAEDVVQDAFLTLWRQPERYHPERGTVRSWLLAIVHHRSIDRLRRNGLSKRIVELTPDLVDRSAIDPSDIAVATLEREYIAEALSRLPAEQRRAIELSYLQGRTHAEIAELMNCPLGTVKGRIRIGLDKLRVMIAAPELVAA